MEKTLGSARSSVGPATGIRTVVLITAVAFFASVGGALRLLFGERLHLKAVPRFVSFMSGIGLKILGVKVECVGTPRDGAQFVIGNHLSTLDILIISSLKPCMFVTSTDMDKESIAGKLTRASGCIVVDRSSRSNREKELSQITTALRGGNSVLVFPEATSTNGTSVIPFRTGMFPAAIEAQTPIQCFTINYRKIQGEELSLANRDRIFYYAGMDLVTHLKSLCELGTIRVEVEWHPMVLADTITDPKLLAQKCHQTVASTYKPVI